MGDSLKISKKRWNVRNASSGEFLKILEESRNLDIPVDPNPPASTPTPEGEPPSEKASD